MAAPTLVVVPGIWEGPTVYDPVLEILARASPAVTDAHKAPLRSTGCTSPGNPTLQDDIQGIRDVVLPLVQAGKRIALVAHSAGGFLAAAALDGLEVGGKDAGSAGGGVEKLFFIAAGLFPAGSEHKSLPFMDFQGDKMFCVDADRMLFNDVPADAAATYKARFLHQPGANWGGVIPHAAWDVIPSTYLVCENDACLPPPKQKYMAEASKCTIVSANVGHMATIAAPELVAEKLLAWIRA